LPGWSFLVLHRPLFRKKGRVVKDIPFFSNALWNTPKEIIGFLLHGLIVLDISFFKKRKKRGLGCNLFYLLAQKVKLKLVCREKG
jgi:hypothetical protein